MSNEENKDPEHDHIFSMLPWYVNQTLEPEQRASVFRHLSHCDECRREVKLLTSLNETVQSDAEGQYRTHADIESNLARVMNQIDTTASAREAGTSWLSLLKQNLEKVLSFSHTLSSAQWGATAVAGILVAVLGFQLYSGKSEDDYSVLSSSDTIDSSMRLSIEITSTADREQAESIIRRELEKLGQRFDIESDANTLFLVVFRDAVGVSELNNLIVDLKYEGQIKGVELLP